MARFLALFMGAWLSLVQSDAGLFHACSTGNAAVAAMDAALAHSASHAAEPRGADAPAADLHADHSAHHAAAPEAAPDVGHGTSHAPTQHDHRSGDNECHCIGHCCVTTVPALRAPDTFALVTEVRIATVQPGRASHAVVAEWADYVLPFATAPPAVLAG
jgi:hypothetical protein